MQRTVRNIAIILLLALLAYGFSLVGTPAHNRKVKMDLATLNRANNVHLALLSYYHHNKTLPATLNAEELNKHASEESCMYNNYNYFMNETLNAEALSRYEYSASNNRYKICANFNNDWSEIKKDLRLNNGYEANRYDWIKDFSAGRACFERTLTNCKKRK